MVNIYIDQWRWAQELKQVELRRLQMTGGASYTVSLPKDWVKEQGLKVGDVVAVLPRSDSSLTLVPHGLTFVYTLEKLRGACSLDQRSSRSQEMS